jgi:hypothetical protein
VATTSASALLLRDKRAICQPRSACRREPPSDQEQSPLASFLGFRRPRKDPRQHARGGRPRWRSLQSGDSPARELVLEGATRPNGNALTLVHRSFPWTTTATNPSNPRQ